MNCKACGGNLVKIGVTEDNRTICKCKDCGETYTFSTAKKTPKENLTTYTEAEVKNIVKYKSREIEDEKDLPAKFRMMSALSYLGHSLLYALPVIGFIFLIIHACDKSYINRMHYARSFLVPVIFAVIGLVVWFFIFGGVAIISALL